MMTETGNPLVSMVVLSYNQSQFVVETLESVKAQTYKPTQLIIVDDCSSDDSVVTIERWSQANAMDHTFIRHQKNLGICKSLNDALAAATGKYVSMVASDDLWLPDKIALQLELMESQPEHVGVVYSDAFQMDEQGRLLPDKFIAAHRNLPEMPQGQILNVLLDGNFIPAMSTLVRRSCYDEVGLYDESLPWEDWDMWLRIARRYSFVYSPTPSAKYRRHQRSLSRSNHAAMLKGSIKTCLKQFGLGEVNEEQRSKLIAMLFHMSEELYSRRDTESADVLLGLWQATGNKKAGWMYRFARLGVSYRNWQRANAWRLRLRRVARIVTKTPRGCDM
jgi:glycosyltransferase involved in cell wall biosynthesis